MHELSIAEALLELVREKVPPEGRVVNVCMEAGPLRGIDPDAMAWAWRAVTEDTECAGARLVVEVLPWKMRCDLCGGEFSAADPYTDCPCGGAGGVPLCDDRIVLTAVEWETEEPPHCEQRTAFAVSGRAVTGREER